MRKFVRSTLVSDELDRNYY